MVIDETGDRKDGSHTAQVGRQYLTNVGKIDNGVMSVTSLWADERVSYPLDVEPYTPAHWFEAGRADPAVRTKPEIALELVQRAVGAGLAFRAVVADRFYGEHEGFWGGLHQLGVGYVLALKPSHTWWHRAGEPGSGAEIARGAGWKDAQQPGQWVRIDRVFRDGHQEAWWALEAIPHPDDREAAVRYVVVTTDPSTLPEPTTWYLKTNLPAPNSQRAKTSPLPSADLAEIVRLYGLRIWVEQGYKQVKLSLGWAQYQVRSDRAIRRHWTLVCCAFTFCWWHASHSLPQDDQPASSSGFPGTPQAHKKRGVRNPSIGQPSPGPSHYARFGPGFGPGSCSVASGWPGRHCPSLSCSSNCLTGSGRAMPSISISWLNPCQQTTVRPKGPHPGAETPSLCRSASAILLRSSPIDLPRRYRVAAPPSH